MLNDYIENFQSFVMLPLTSDITGNDASMQYEVPKTSRKLLSTCPTIWVLFFTRLIANWSWAFSSLSSRSKKSTSPVLLVWAQIILHYANCFLLQYSLFFVYVFSVLLWTVPWSKTIDTFYSIKGALLACLYVLVCMLTSVGPYRLISSISCVSFS